MTNITQSVPFKVFMAIMLVAIIQVVVFGAAYMVLDGGREVAFAITILSALVIVIYTAIANMASPAEVLVPAAATAALLFLFTVLGAAIGALSGGFNLGPFALGYTIIAMAIVSYAMSKGGESSAT